MSLHNYFLVYYMASLASRFFIPDARSEFKFGISWYLKPMMESEFVKVPKTTMQCVFHYVSVFLVLAAVILVAIGRGKLYFYNNALLVKFIGLNYLLFGLVQIMYATKNKVERPLITMFQWTMLLPIRYFLPAFLK